MPAIFALAPAKIILFGEHAVVYGRPAIAIPITQLRAKAVITPIPLSSPGIVIIEAPNIGLNSRLDDLPVGHPLREVVNIVTKTLMVSIPPSLKIRITSTIPMASGLGSGTAVSVAIIRALSAYLGKPLPDQEVSDLAYQIEKIYHGTPSGIDNSVITFGKPVFFIRNQPIQFIEVAHPLALIIGDTGVYSPTSKVVEKVHYSWEANPSHYESMFDDIGAITLKGKEAIQNGNSVILGQLLTQNHAILQELGVSSPELDHLVKTALDAGALGAKLSGGGQGGNMIALVEPGSISEIGHKLLESGAVRTIETVIGKKE